MSALIEGYKYDIFISYRQNDNRYDGWVTEFVANLKKELEATIKEKLTIFFDENPEDGLLEIHSIDKSVEEKLKCLVFIPVISQTYCDIASYAWQYEFRVFNRFARNDRFGRDILLLNDNVSSRILPVRIHEIDAEDKSLLENELGEKLRCIDFIYHSPGVNRPLRATEDHPRDNLNKTYYRDQINKVANAVKEIISALKKSSADPAAGNRTITDNRKPRQKSRVHRGLYLASSLMVPIIVLVVLFSSGRLTRAPLEKSIAVLPFRNDNPGDSNAYFSNIIMEEILNNLQKIKDVRIISRTSVEQYRNTSKSIPQIARELGVNYIVEGSGQRHSKLVRVNVQLIRAKKEGYIWGRIYEQSIEATNDIIRIQSAIAQDIVKELEGTITPQEKQLIEKIPTTNLTAYDFYQKGKEALTRFWIDITDKESLEKAGILFKKALNYDPSFAEAIAGQAEVLWNYRDSRDNIIDSVLLLTDLAITIDNKIAEAYVIKGWCYDEKGYADKAYQQYTKAIDLNPNDWKAYFGLAELYDFKDPVRSLTNLKISASLTHGAVELPTLLRHIGGELLITGFFDKADQYFTRAFELDGDSAVYLTCMGGIEHNRASFEKAIDFYKHAYRIRKNNPEILHNLALFSQLTGKYEESLEFYRELQALGPVTYNEHRIGFTLWKNGFHDEGNKIIEKYLKKCLSFSGKGARADHIAYNNYDLAGIYAFRGDRQKAYHYLNEFNQVQNCFTYMITLIKNDPMLESLKNDPEFQGIITDMQSKLDRVHHEVGEWLLGQEDF
ncbi:MAG TPA: hypothetical protein VHO68_08850 [Bacteroidales bacterium]|nr:hypothetical protein [Bacteroidales bacterium]